MKEAQTQDHNYRDTSNIKCRALLAAIFDDVNEWENLARLGRPRAAYEAGRCYWNGIGAEQNYALAFNCFQLGAGQGDGQAMYHLAICYLDGMGTEQNKGLGIYWLVRAATSDHPFAQAELGICFANGNDMMRCPREAYLWLRISGIKRLPQCNAELGRASQHYLDTLAGLEKSLPDDVLRLTRSDARKCRQKLNAQFPIDHYHPTLNYRHVPRMNQAGTP